jgi:putative flippase GtrA
VPPIHKIIYHASRSEFTRYFWAGSVAFLTDLIVLLLLTEAVGVNYLWSNLVSVSAGMMMSYLLCVNWVFVHRRYNQAVFEFSVFILASVVGLVLNEVMLWSLVEFGQIHYLGAKIFVTLFIFVINFCLKKRLLFSQ